jgi:hypothetical protein
MFKTILFTFLALSPQGTSAYPDFGAALDHAEVVDGGDDVQMIAYDPSGAVIGSIALWVGTDGATYSVSDYAEGYSQVTILPDGSVLTEGNLPAELAAERADLVLAAIDANDPAQAKWMRCAVATGIMVGTCATGSIIACPFSAMAAACECLPKLEPKWKNKSC